jgi:hypothetical protein
MHEGMKSDSKHEHSTHGITNLKPNSLQEASGVGGVKRVLTDPPQTDDESQSLNEISKS